MSLGAQQRGAALLAMLAVLALGASWWLVSALATVSNRTAGDRTQNARVLAEAKQALLGYVVNIAADSAESFPGRLPCPEPAVHIGTSNEGITAPYAATGATCSAVASNVAVGRLPWRTLGIDKFRDAAGEPLWYAVTIGATGWALQTSATALSINSNKAGGLTVGGDAVIAAIIAPGRPMNLNPTGAQLAAGCAARTQNRSVTPPNYLDYLECHNFAGNSLLTTVTGNAANEVLNDQMVTITAAEVMNAIEGVIAARIKSSVVPQLQAVYNNADWGASAATPIYPYAARFQNAGAFNPDSYQGTVGQSQGLLPMTAQTCNALTAGRCSSTFVGWTLASFSVTKTGGTATLDSVDCAASYTVSQITCTVTYSQLVGVLAAATVSLAIQVDAANVGRTLKKVTLSDAAVTPIAPVTKAGFAFSAALRTDANASARVSATGTLTGSTGILFCGFIGIACVGRATLTLPIAMFQDHPLVNPAATDAWYWYTVNKWYEVTYYSAAPSHLPSGAVHNCSTAGDCLTVSAGSPSANISSVLTLAGRSLTGAARPNSSLTDFLETASGTYPTFTQDKWRRTTYNDRFVTVSNY